MRERTAPPEPVAAEAETSQLPSDLVDRIIQSYTECGQEYHHLGCHEMPSAAEVERVLEGLRELLFPGFAGTALPPGQDLRTSVALRLEETAERLRRQVYRGMHHRCRSNGELASEPAPVPIRDARSSRMPNAACVACSTAANRITARVLDQLPALRKTLALDVKAAFDGDPAATGIDEIIFSYPGVYAISVYRIANLLHREGATIIPRMLTEHAHRHSGVDIHPGATIGESFFIDHGTGIVIGETTVIGRRVRIYQGVTLGALSLPQGKVRVLNGQKRHPTIEDDVIIYANSTILGGETVIGKGAVIGGNTWITRSVPPGTKLTVDGSTLVVA